MDENQEQLPQQQPDQQPEETEKEVYTPRPAWQVWGARIALVIFILYVIMYYINVMRGGR